MRPISLLPLLLLTLLAAASIAATAQQTVTVVKKTLTYQWVKDNETKEQTEVTVLIYNDNKIEVNNIPLEYNPTTNTIQLPGCEVSGIDYGRDPLALLYYFPALPKSLLEQLPTLKELKVACEGKTATRDLDKLRGEGLRIEWTTYTGYEAINISTPIWYNIFRLDDGVLLYHYEVAGTSIVVAKLVKETAETVTQTVYTTSPATPQQTTTTAQPSTVQPTTTTQHPVQATSPTATQPAATATTQPQPATTPAATPAQATTATTTDGQQGLQTTYIAVGVAVAVVAALAALLLRRH